MPHIFCIENRSNKVPNRMHKLVFLIYPNGLNNYFDINYESNVKQKHIDKRMLIKIQINDINYKQST